MLADVDTADMPDARRMRPVDIPGMAVQIPEGGIQIGTTQLQDSGVYVRPICQALSSVLRKNPNVIIVLDEAQRCIAPAVTKGLTMSRQY